MKLPWKYILVSFAIGLLLGGSVGLYSAHDLARHWARKSPEMFLKRLNRDLHLTESQRAEIASVLEIRRNKMEAYENQVRRETRMEIRSRLSPEQQPPFDAITAKHDAERRKLEGH